jgi:phosphoribosylformylglycinamidine synthase subunit PurQ / glutaminase
MAARIGVIVFPGSNCDHDAYHATRHVLGQDARFIWHKEEDLGDLDMVIVPGGFSYGDYLRSGAIARFSTIMKEVVRFANAGGPVLGVCNGFQILCESGLLPGALMRNASLRFVCKPVNVRVESTETPFTRNLAPGEVLELPVAHGEGNYFAAADELERLEGEGQVVFRYVDQAGVVTAGANPNGSANNIGGVRNASGNVLGMMPHPERHVEGLLGSTDGNKLFESALVDLGALVG